MAYDSLALLIDAVQRARSTRTLSVAQQSCSTRNFIGLVGKISIDRYRNAIKPVFIVGLNRSLHKIAPIWQ